MQFPIPECGVNCNPTGPDPQQTRPSGFRTRNNPPHISIRRPLLPGSSRAPQEIPPTEVNNLPTIEADDKVLAVDAPSNPLEDVIAYDTEDGTLIEQIIVTNNTADTGQPGKYEVTYQVTDVKGAFTVKTKMDSDTTTIEKDRTDTKKYDVKTNKQKNMVMRIIILAAVITTVFLVLERRNQNNKIARTITCTSFVYISRCFDFKRKLEYSRRAE